MGSDNIRSEDFTAMRWNIREIPEDVAVTVKFPELYNMFMEFESTGFEVQGVESDKIIRYIIYCYHKRSPLVKKIQDIFQRKFQALVYAGIKNLEDEEVKKLYGNENERVVQGIMQFLRFEGDLDYMALTTQVEAYYNWSQAIMVDNGKSGDIKARASIFEPLQKLKTSIDKLSETVFQGDDALVNFVASQKVLHERKKLSPEDNAKSGRR